MGAFTMGLARLLLPGMILAAPRVGSVSHLSFGKDADRRRNPCLGHRDQSDRKGTSAGARNRQGRRAALRAEGVPGCHGPTGQAAKLLR